MLLVRSSVKRKRICWHTVRFGLLLVMALMLSGCGCTGGLNGTCSSFQTFVGNIINDIYLPINISIYFILSVIGGVIFVVGLFRLRFMGLQGAAQTQRVSPFNTIMYLIIGTLLLHGSAMQSISYLLGAFNVSLFMTPGGPGAPLLAGDVFTGSSVLQYVNLAGTTGTITTGDVILQLTGATLFLVGIFAFGRGMLMLIKIGDGPGPDNSVTKAITHIVAGLLAVNAINILNVMGVISVINTAS